mmetsp:Transcript_5530/g.8166  ORF Transcript_5530/g.8166 Transcript_5530/m.8166 type:complete len:1011 (-) Transcript_5530:1058-4090(-)
MLRPVQNGGQTSVQRPQHRFEMLGEQVSNGKDMGLYSRARSELSNRPRSTDADDFKSKTLKNEREIEKLTQRVDYTKGMEQRETVLLQRIRNLENELMKQEKDSSSFAKSMARMTADMEQLQREVQENSEESPQLVSMLAKRWREKLKTEFYEYTDERTEQVSTMIHNEKKVLAEQIRMLEKKLRRQQEEGQQLNREQSKELEGMKETMSYLKKTQKAIQKHAEKNFDKKIKSVTTVMNELKSLVLKKIEMNSLEQQNELKDVQHVSLERFKVAQTNLKKLANELNERFDRHKQQIRDNHQYHKDALMKEHKKMGKRYEMISNELNHLRSTTKKTLIRINQESKLSHSVQKYQEKQMKDFLNRLERYNQAQAIQQTWDAIWSGVDHEIVSIELRKEFKNLTNKFPGQINRLETTIQQNTTNIQLHNKRHNANMKEHEERLSGHDQSLSNLSKNIDKNKDAIEQNKQTMKEEISLQEEALKLQEEALQQHDEHYQKYLRKQKEINQQHEERLNDHDYKLKEHQKKNEEAISALSEVVENQQEQLHGKLNDQMDTFQHQLKDQEGTLKKQEDKLMEHQNALNENKDNLKKQHQAMEDAQKEQQQVNSQLQHVIVNNQKAIDDAQGSIDTLNDQREQLAQQLDEHSDTLVTHQTQFKEQANQLESLQDRVELNKKQQDTTLQKLADQHDALKLHCDDQNKVNDSQFMMLKERMNNQASKISTLMQNDETEFINQRLDAHEKQINENADLLIEQEGQMMEQLDAHDERIMQNEIQLTMNDMLAKLDHHETNKRFKSITAFMNSTNEVFDVIHYQNRQKTRDEVVVSIMTSIFDQVNDHITAIETQNMVEELKVAQTASTESQDKMNGQLAELRDEFHDEMKHHVIRIETTMDKTIADTKQLKDDVPLLQNALQDLAVRTATDQLILQTQLDSTVNERVVALENTMQHHVNQQITNLTNTMKHREDQENEDQQAYLSLYTCENIVNDIVQGAMNTIEVNALMDQRADLFHALKNL